MNILIGVDAGQEIGFGHVVRMRHLADVLQMRGHCVLFKTNDVAKKYLQRFFDAGQFLDHNEDAENFDVYIGDYMTNTDAQLRRYRMMDRGPRTIVTVVGSGYSITAKTHWMSDLIVYQDARVVSPKLPGIAAEVLSGARYIMIDPAYGENPRTEDTEVFDDLIVVYVGGGSSDNKLFGVQLAEAFQQRGYKTIMLNWGNNWVENTYMALQNAAAYVGSMGMIAYEAASYFVPSFLISRSPDHAHAAAYLDTHYSYINSLGRIGEKSTEEIADYVHEKLQGMSQNAANWRLYRLNVPADGFGVYRVANVILQLAQEKGGRK